LPRGTEKNHGNFELRIAYSGPRYELGTSLTQRYGVSTVT